MVRSVFSKVMWVGRATVFLVGLAVILAVIFGVASMAFARNGDPWRLGRDNAATNITRLAGAAGVNGPMVRITNNSDGADDTALELLVQSGEPPMRVNSATKVEALNADYFDGKDSSDYVQLDSNVFLRNKTFEYESPLSTGTLDDGGPDAGTYFIDTRCPALTNPDYPPTLVSGGFNNIDPGTTVVESYPTTNFQQEDVWRVRIENNNTLDSFSVVVKCVDQRPQPF